MSCEVPMYNFLASVLAKAAVILAEAIVIRLVQTWIDKATAPQHA
ncbi:hypothetical protein Ssi03_40190 [Sphaerisporangium siamense]|nr:hypothetical protein Ssi03_40190 [Sphaerisporangium siamense]